MLQEKLNPPGERPPAPPMPGLEIGEVTELKWGQGFWSGIKAGLKRILYKHYIFGVCWVWWLGVGFLVDPHRVNSFWGKHIGDGETFWGVFLVVAPLVLLWSERFFIVNSNSPSIED